MTFAEYLIKHDFIVFVLVGIGGMVVHWAKKWLRAQTKCSLITYLFVKNRRYTALAFLTYTAAIATILAMGIVDYKSHQSMAMAFMAGYMIDSALNKDDESAQ